MMPARAARVDASGQYVALDDQDRSLWNREQAAITLVQMQAPDEDSTEWAQIAQL